MARVGRPPWTTPEQTAFLESHVPKMEAEKKRIGLKAFYDQVAAEFQKRWPAEPTSKEKLLCSDTGKLQSVAKERQVGVRFFLFHFTSLLAARADWTSQQIHQWYKTLRKSLKNPPPPKPLLLDLTGAPIRKPTPLQFHHAYSIRYFRPNHSPLRTEVKDLWNRRKEQEVIDILPDFLDDDTTTDTTHLNFHNAVMRWKCSLMNEEERQDLQKWIDESTQEKSVVLDYLWKAGLEDGADELSAENEYVQRCVTSSPNRQQYIKLT